MRRVVVDSSSVVSVGYAADSRILEVEFSSGGIYQYLEVPAEEHVAVMASSSKGKYVNHAIKSRFSCLRVEVAQ